MTNPKMRPCPKCANSDVELYGYGDWGTTWHVECDDCHYMGPGGNKLQAIREHNAIADTHPKDGDVKQAPLVSGGGAQSAIAQPPRSPSKDIS